MVGRAEIALLVSTRSCDWKSTALWPVALNRELSLTASTSTERALGDNPLQVLLMPQGGIGNQKPLQAAGRAIFPPRTPPGGKRRLLSAGVERAVPLTTPGRRPKQERALQGGALASGLRPKSSPRRTRDEAERRSAPGLPPNSFSASQRGKHKRQAGQPSIFQLLQVRGPTKVGPHFNLERPLLTKYLLFTPVCATIDA